VVEVCCMLPEAGGWEAPDDWTGEVVGVLAPEDLTGAVTGTLEPPPTEDQVTVEG